MNWWLRDKYGDSRRTTIAESKMGEAVTTHELMPEETCGFRLE